MPFDPIREVRLRMHRRNKNWLCVITGETGSGKSYTALTLAHKIFPGFGVAYVVFTVEEFMTLLNSGLLKRGDVIVFDEAGVGIPAREWQSLSNKLMGYILQTFRHENVGVIFTVPSFDFIDAQARRLVHTYIETRSINHTEKKVIVKLFTMEYNSRMGIQYFKYPVMTKDGRTVKLTNIRIGLPPKWLRDAYEEKKKKFTSQLKKDVEQSIRDAKEKSRPKNTYTEDELMGLIMERKNEFVKIVKNQPYVNKTLIMVEFKVGRSVAEKTKVKIEKEMRDQALKQAAHTI